MKHRTHITFSHRDSGLRRTACRVGVILGGLLVTCVLVAHPASAKLYSDRIVAVVNGSVILESDLQRHKQPWMRSLASFSLGVIPPGKWPTEKELLDELIIIRLLEQEAAKKGINPNDKAVDASIGLLQQRNKLPHDRFVLFLAANGMNYSDFRELWKRRIKIEGLVSNEVTKKVALSEEDAQNYFKKNQGKINEQYDKLMQSLAPPKPPETPQAEPQIPTHQEVFVGGTVRLKLVTLKLPHGASKKEVQQVMNKAKRIVEDARNGADFGELAKKYSQDPLASKGGDLGQMAYKDMSADWQKLVERMKKDQVAGPFPAKGTVVIFYLADEKGRTLKKIPIPEKYRKELKKQLDRERATRLAEEKQKARSEKENPEGAKAPQDPESEDLDENLKKPTGILSPEEEKEYRKVRAKVIAIMKHDKIEARTKEWIEELKKNSIIDVKL